MSHYTAICCSRFTRYFSVISGTRVPGQLPTTLLLLSVLYKQCQLPLPLLHFLCPRVCTLCNLCLVHVAMVTLLSDTLSVLTCFLHFMF